MKTKDRIRFEADALRKLAGEKAFARGEAYYRAGQVEILSLELGRVLARVAGTEDYTVVLKGGGKTIGGECSCPAFEDWGPCKHMVATALAANAGGAADGAGVFERIRYHLKAKDIDALVAMIMDLAERDLGLFRKLEIAAAAAHADDKTLDASLRKALDGATRTRGFVDYREAAGWASGVDAALDTLATLAPGPRAGLARTLAERAIGHIERAIENMDDSDGHAGALLERAQGIHIEACRAAKPDPVELARALFAREMTSEYGVFSGAARLYADVLGEAGLAEYRRLAVEAWSKLAPRTGSPPEKADGEVDHSRLASILDFFAERDGDVEMRIAIRAKDLSSPWRYLRLAEFCRAEGRLDEALRYAEEGAWIFEDGRPDERLVNFLADLLSKAGRTGDAEAHLWRAFEKAPSLELYKRLRTLGGKAMRDRAIAFLDGLAAKKRSRWDSPSDLLIGVFMREKMFEAAWAAVRAHGASMGAKDALAKASGETHPSEALAVYAERVEQLANAGGERAYEEAAVLIARMAALRPATAQTAYVADLKDRFRRKRNLMKLLD